MTQTVIDVDATRSRSYVEWAPIFAGAAGATALSFLLLTFGSSIGLSAVSPWPNSGLPVKVIGIIAALWVVIVQVGSFAAGGYVAGRLRAPVSDKASPERHFRDGAHGFLVWSVGTLLGVIAMAMTSGAALKAGADVASNVAGGATQAVASGAVANGPAQLGVDLLLRSDVAASQQPVAAANSAGDMNGELNRLFVRSLESGSVAPTDRDYLAGLIARRTGLPAAEAQKRIDDAFAAARQARVKALEAADAARRTAALAGFLAAASLLISLVAATAGAGLGGRHRDENTAATIFGGSRFW
jgi:hypothetical protein